MSKDAAARKFDLVIFWSLDRLSREGVLATLNHLELLTPAGVNWRSFTTTAALPSERRCRLSPVDSGSLQIVNW